MAGRLTVCNMSIKAGARAGLVAPDDVTFAYLEGRPHAPSGAAWEAALDYWRTLPSDEDATFDHEVRLRRRDADAVRDLGHQPGAGAAARGVGAGPGLVRRPGRPRRRRARADLHGPVPGTALRDVSVDAVFVGSCTNGRIEDLRAAAAVLRGRKVAAASGCWWCRVDAVRAQAEQEGLDAVFTAAGAEWRSAGCSMCLGMNPDTAHPGERSASTSNRNFEGRQGKGGRTHLVSPEVAAATAVTGHLAAPADLWQKDESCMEPFVTHTGRAVPLRRNNVDTDQIIPAEYLKRVSRAGFGEGLFAAWREDPSFVLNQPQYAGATILVAGTDFGTGSSREHAVWALPTTASAR